MGGFLVFIYLLSYLLSEAFCFCGAGPKALCIYLASTLSRHIGDPFVNVIELESY